MKDQKLYVLVDKCLRRSQQTVQAAHAVAEFCLKDRGKQWTNGILVICEVNDVREWLNWADAEFREPDLANMLTAVACFGINNLAKI